MRLTNETDVPMKDLIVSVRSHVARGFGIACIYIKEGSDDFKKTMETILVSHEEAVRLTSVLKKNTYKTLSKEFPAAGIYEREMFEMSRAAPFGNADMRPLKLRSIREGSYPLQKSEPVPADEHPTPIPRNEIKGEGLFEIPVGPIHAGVIGPGHFRFSVAGEPIIMLRAYLGYTYRGIEKMLETSADKDLSRIMERVSGDNGIAHSLAYLQAMEGDADIPERARYIRTIYAELERIHHLLGGISGIIQDTALSVPAAKGYMLKERMHRLNEKVTGHRLLWGSLCIGGVRIDIDEHRAKMIDAELKLLRTGLDDLFNMALSSASFMDRAETTGVLSPEDAVRLRVVGPAARGSGIDYDVRKNHPYEAYDRIEMKTATHVRGDVYARFRVKMNEISEAADIITQCLNKMENGPILIKVGMRDGFSMGMVESPRGELIHCVHVMNGKIWRYKIRDPSFPNWPALETAALGNIVPDFPLINKSFDLSYSGNDL